MSSIRNSLIQQIRTQEEIIKNSQEIIAKLKVDLVQVNDDISYYKESSESWERKIGKKITHKHIVGRKYWTETDVDDAGNTIEIECSEVVKLDGNWYFDRL